MTVDNALNSAKIRIAYLIFIFVFSSLLIYALIEEVPKQKYATLFGAALFFCIYLFLNALNLFFVQIEDTQTKLVVRYYFSHPFLSRPKTFDFQKSSFAKYEIVAYLGKLRKDIIFYQSTPKGLLKYPPISISAYSSADLVNLEKLLNRVLMQNKAKK